MIVSLNDFIGDSLPGYFSKKLESIIAKESAGSILPQYLQDLARELKRVLRSRLEGLVDSLVEIVREGTMPLHVTGCSNNFISERNETFAKSLLECYDIILKKSEVTSQINHQKLIQVPFSHLSIDFP